MRHKKADAEFYQCFSNEYIKEDLFKKYTKLIQLYTDMETREKLKRNAKKMQPTLHITALSQIALCNTIIPTDVHHVHDGVIHLMRIGRCNSYHNAGVYTDH